MNVENVFVRYLKKAGACDEAIRWVNNRSLDEVYADLTCETDYIAWLLRMLNLVECTCSGQNAMSIVDCPLRVVEFMSSGDIRAAYPLPVVQEALRRECRVLNISVPDSSAPSEQEVNNE